MALESCSTLSIENHGSHYFFLARGDERGTRDSTVTGALKNWEWGGIMRDALGGPEVRLIPLQLLQFNQTENEE